MLCAGTALHCDKIADADYEIMQGTRSKAYPFEI